MIQHVTHVYSDLEALRAEISTGAVARVGANAQALLVQIYCAEANRALVAGIMSLIAEKLPGAVIVGATTVGEVAHGRLMTRQTVIGFTFFATSRLEAIAMACKGGDEREVGAKLGGYACRASTDRAGVLLLSTPLSINVAALLEGLEAALGGCPVFGGGAGDYAEMANSLVFANGTFFDKGAVAVVLSGSDLHIEPKVYLGWRPLSRAMRVTKVEGLRVLQIDDQPAFEVYHHYLNISNDEGFFLNALEFPFLLEREGGLLARVPVAADESGALQFVADIREGETFRIGYGDIDLIVEDSRDIHCSMARFSPEAIFIYSCGCRRFLMQEHAELETRPFEALAPTFGFYTYGEFCGSSRLALLNSTLVAVSLREGGKEPSKPTATVEVHQEAVPPHSDPYANKHVRVVSRLLRFIDVVTSELEASHREVTQLSVTDRLTRLANRIRLEEVLDEGTSQASRYGTPFAVTLLDVDHFKQVNDTHGHLVGDDVLVRVAQVLKANTREGDVVGRWGGEEFMVIAPHTRTAEAGQLAERLRAAIANLEIPTVGHKTASFGVTEYAAGDDLNQLLVRADAALYSAKRGGRNRVEVDRPSQPN